MASTLVGDKGRQRLEDSGKHRACLVCGRLGHPGRSKMFGALTCRFSFSLPGGALLNTAHSAVHLDWTRRWFFRRKKKKKTPAQSAVTHHFTKRILTVYYKVGDSEISGVARTAVWRWTVSPPPAPNVSLQTTQQPPGPPSCRLTLKKSPRPAWPPCTGHDQSEVNIQLCAARS